MKKLIIKLSVGFFLLVAILLLEYFTDWDTDLQEYFFDRPHNRWLIYPERHQKLSVFFYKGIKTLLAAMALCCLTRLILSLKHKQLRNNNKPYWIMLSSIILVPALVAGAKYITNVYCPYQLNIYNGFYPFVRILEDYPVEFIQPKPGRCFPAGHATAGFAFMALFFCFNTPWKRWLGLTVGLAIGWTAAIYQMYRGQHFLSHSVFSMIAAFMVILLVNEIVSYLFAGKNDTHPTEK